MSDNEPFWMVYGLHQGAPTVMHYTREIAEAEAKRLARNNPGIQFFVLEAVSRAEKIDVQFTRIDRRYLDDGVPF